MPDLNANEQQLGLLRAELGGQYEVQRLIGKGGMGAVYLARELSLDRLVALKVLPSELIDSETRGMVATLKSDYGTATRDTALRPLVEFVAGQRQILEDLALRTEIGTEELEEAGLGDGIKQKVAALQSASHVQ